MRFAYVIVLAAKLLVPGLPAAGQTSAELLQKGIYTQETVGDLDGAIRIYRQVVASANESRALGAQAQFRLATCLLKKGDRAAATKAFEQLIRDYPEQKELVARASEHVTSAASLLPAPWSDGELNEYKIKLPNGTSIGTFTFSVEASPTRSNAWLFSTRAYVNGSPQQWSQVEAERDSMRPISTVYRHALLGELRLEYGTRQVRVQPAGKDARTIALDGAYWDNEQALWVMRRTALSVGYKAALPLVTPVGAALKFDVEVTGIVDIQVKAGKFRCFKVEFGLVRQTLYIAVDAPHQVVRMDANGVQIELEESRRVSSAPVEFRDPSSGLAVTAPAGWIFAPNGGSPASESSISMLDPEGKATVSIWARVEKSEAAAIPATHRQRVDEKVRDRVAFLKDYKVRPESIQVRTIGGQQALSCVADFTEQDRKMVEYLVWVTAENSRSLFFARVPAAELDSFRARFDPILETARIN